MNFKKIAEDLNLPEHLTKVMLQVDAQLTAANIPHAVIGGIAVGGYSKPRTTKDVDFLINFQDLDRVKKLFPKHQPLLMNNRQGISTQVEGIDVDFICHQLRETFVLTEPTYYHGINIPGKAGLLYLKLTSGRTSDFNDIVQICKGMSPEEQQKFVSLISSLKVQDLDKEEMLENFQSCCQIATLEMEQDQKQASKQFRRLMLKKLSGG